MYDPPHHQRHNLSTGYHRNNGRACCHEVAVASELLLLHPQRLESDRRLHCAVQIALQCVALHCIVLYCTAHYRLYCIVLHCTILHCAVQNAL